MREALHVGAAVGIVALGEALLAAEAVLGVLLRALVGSCATTALAVELLLAGRLGGILERNVEEVVFVCVFEVGALAFCWKREGLAWK